MGDPRRLDEGEIAEVRELLKLLPFLSVIINLAKNAEHKQWLREQGKVYFYWIASTNTAGLAIWQLWEKWNKLWLALHTFIGSGGGHQ